ncbi:hypothetical protein CABS01_08117, partial [Colletotrichum abscissum]|uniref:uncharacterized protein n=1 Tax=Colletotrichum abscissum TaxID=1671311 RepID=UPI0027D5DDF7
APLVPGDATHLNILNRWVKGCNEAQHLPNRKSFIPSRLLLVGDEDTRFVRLISKPESKSGSVNYIALSHRWGNDSSTEGKFVTTTTDNIHVIASALGIDDDYLPKTFLDAVVITRRLKVKYLWIDSLCILQDNMNHGNMDSKNDWDRESKLMEEVFGSAYITIAASCAENRFQGFLKARTPRQLRGWVLQERALSRRTLHFTSSQTYWECGEGIRCETFTKTTNRKAAFLGDSNFPHSVESFKQGRQLQHYHDLYERYSSLKLTYPTDKPRAIAGLEKRLTMALKSTGGYGIFLSNLHRDLLWQRRNIGTSLRRIGFQPHEEIPSWSWMAFEGEIRYMNVPFGDIERAKDISSPFETQTGRGAEETSDLSKKAYFQATARTLMSDNPARLIMDDPERILRRPLMCVIVGTSKQNKSDPVRHYALMVAPVMDKEEDKVFERVGVAYLSEDEVSIEEGTGIVRIQ